jgi:hypothetical protein
MNGIALEVLSTDANEYYYAQHFCVPPTAIYKNPVISIVRWSGDTDLVRALMIPASSRRDWHVTDSEKTPQRLLLQCLKQVCFSIRVCRKFSRDTIATKFGFRWSIQPLVCRRPGLQERPC